ncbi:HAMP domain-containing protein [Brevibacillus borstelensis]|uniref:HAMP domain-containing protein n=1 Tax=Brevibacillus borstelensis TaxID=45462 RepID=UPI0030C3695F
MRIVLQDERQRQHAQYGDQSASLRVTGSTVLPVVVDGKTVGYLTISHHERAASHSVETHFQQAHTSALLWTMLILIVVVVLASIGIAKTMVKPIVRMSDASMAASKGDWSVRVPPTSGKDELAGLVDRFNNLIESLEHQEQLRKRLTSDISHELRTPLNTLLAQTEGDRSRNRERGGAGLGLTIARGLVEAHGGQISIQSQKGLGTSVTMRFPAAEKQPVVDTDSVTG